MVLLEKYLELISFVDAVRDSLFAHRKDVEVGWNERILDWE